MNDRETTSLDIGSAGRGGAGTGRVLVAAAPALVLVLLTALLPLAALAADPEGCLTCHQYRGLSRLDKEGKKVELFFIDPNLHSGAAGPHARIRCTGCHVREEVEVYPHKPTTAVDCTRTCHITTARGLETRFGHDKLAHMLEKSAHTPKVLARSNELLGSPLDKGQSQCLLCHDEPTFRRPGSDFTQRQAPIQRCNSCHDDQLKLPVNTEFNFWHVTSRGRHARNNQDLVRVCATCHANDKVRAEFKLPDSALSYLASFHGKATQLNNETASCLDCHVGEKLNPDAPEDPNVHMILSRKDPNSPTHEANVANTCRTPACHRLAGEQISSAAIHMDLHEGGGIEWLIAVIFFGMIISTFGPSMVITLLKLLNFAAGREAKDPEHLHHVAVARRLMENTAARHKLKRFTVHQRLQHWFLVITFATLCLTGFPMKFADRAWAQWFIGVFGGLTTVRWIHRITGALLLVGFLYHWGYIVAYMVRQRKATRQSWLKVFFGLPLCMQPKDMKEMLGLLLYLVGLKKHKPTAGRFTAEEKFEYFGVFWGTMLLGVTGLLMWFNAYTSRWIPGRFLTISNLVHSFEAFLALLHVGILHMAAVIFSPVVFPISPAMFTGDTPPEEMAEAHSELLEDVAGEHGHALEHGAGAGHGHGPVAAKAGEKVEEVAHV